MYETQGKRLAVIGNGSSGIQIVPAVLPKSAHIDHYIRGRTWLSPTFAREKVDLMGKGLDNCESPSLLAVPWTCRSQSYC
jgi:cation diffusion facilitator CzcD-associated flavoprotein CzcO